MVNIYKLENRQMQWLYHWFIYILGGLRHLEKNNEKTIVYLEWFKDWHNYEKLSFKYFEDKFIFLTAPNQLLNYSNITFINFHGEPVIQPDTVHFDTYKYLRSKLLLKTYEFVPKKYIYLTRAKSNLLPQTNNTRLREINNEPDVLNMLTQLGFRFTQLEDLDLDQKIELFNTSEIILGPWSGGLTFSLVANPKTTIVDIMPPEWFKDFDHYGIICKSLNIQHFRFNGAKKMDENWNMEVDINLLKNFVTKLIV